MPESGFDHGNCDAHPVEGNDKIPNAVRNGDPVPPLEGFVALVEGGVNDIAGNYPKDAGAEPTCAHVCRDLVNVPFVGEFLTTFALVAPVTDTELLFNSGVAFQVVRERDHNGVPFHPLPLGDSVLEVAPLLGNDFDQPD